MGRWGAKLQNKAKSAGNSTALRRDAATARREALLAAVLRAARRHVVDMRPHGCPGLYRATAGYLAALRSVVGLAPWKSAKRVPANREDLLLAVRHAAARHVDTVTRVATGIYAADAANLSRLREAIDKAWDATHVGIETDLNQEISNG